MSSQRTPWRRDLKKKACIFCGGRGGHPDHVPPKNMYFGEPDDLITVPSCLSCNGGVSDFDKLFRNVVAAKFKITDKAGDEWLRAAVRGAIKDGRVQRVMEASHYRIAGTDIGWVAVPTDGFAEVCERVCGDCIGGSSARLSHAIQP